MDKRMPGETILLLLVVLLCHTHLIFASTRWNAYKLGHRQYGDTNQPSDIQSRDTEDTDSLSDIDESKFGLSGHSSRISNEEAIYAMDSTIDRQGIENMMAHNNVRYGKMAGARIMKKSTRQNWLENSRQRELGEDILDRTQLATERAKERKKFWKILRNIQQQPSFDVESLAKRHPPPPPGFHAIRGKRN